MAGIALVAFFAYGIYRAGEGDVPPPPSNSSIVFHEGVATGHRITTRSWTAHYARIVSNADQSILDLYDVTDGTIFKHGVPYLHVRCTELTVNTVTRDFTATGPLHVEMASGPRRSFETTSAVWNDGLQQLTLDRHTLVHTATLKPLSLGSLVFDVKTGDVQMRGITGDVRW
jgi:hypothetical protein